MKEPIRHCGRRWEYRDLGVRIAKDEAGMWWYWLCPGCGEVIGRESWDPPALEYRVGASK